MHIHAHSHSVPLSHTQLKKKKDVSQINTGKVQYVHVIYPKFMKRNKTKGKITLAQNGKACRSPLLYCSFTPSRLQNREKNRKREEGRKNREREAPVLSSYSHLVCQEWLTPYTTGHRMLPSVASLLLTLHLCPAVQGGGGRMGRGEIRRAGQGRGSPFTVIH